MTYTCLSELIGIKDACGDVVGTSGYYVQDLPFATEDMADLALNKRTESSPLDYYLNKRDSAARLLFSDIQSIINTSGDFMLSSVANIETIGKVNQDFSQIMPDRSGVKVWTGYNCNDRLVTYKVRSVTIYVAADWQGDLNVNDGISGVTRQVSLIANMPNKIIIDAFLDINSPVFITLSGANMLIYRNIARYYSSCGCSSPNSCVQVTATHAGADSNAQYFGFTVEIEHGCAIDTLVCDIGKYFVKALFYKIGYLILENRKMNYARLNSSTKNKVDLSADVERYDMMYKDELKLAYYNIKQYLSSNKSVCVKCLGAKIKQYGF